MVKVTENPTTTDEIVFDLTTFDVNGCLNDPYKVDRLVIYYVERDFSSNNLSAYKDNFYVEEKLKAAEEAEITACANPSEENIRIAQRARLDAESSKTQSDFYFNESKPVHIVGNKEFPAWLSTDLNNSFLTHVTEDEDENPLVGQFQYTWQPVGMREGDYFICWTWTPLAAGESYSQHFKFYLRSSTQITTAISTHITQPQKYETLMDRYTPEMFKMKLHSEDRSPDVVQKLNLAVADGFTVLEDLANQIIDLYDGNVLDESLLPYLSNTLDLKLKSYDPTRWRKQIKRAIPLYKRKGTKNGLREALDQAGITLEKYTSLWQVVSSYTWQEIFEYDGTEASWDLEKVALPVDLDNFSLFLLAVDEEEYVELSPDYVSFEELDGVTTMIWQGSNLSVNQIDLVEGDIIKVLYKYNNIPTLTDQSVENYIRSLPLADQRNERSQDYPLKNMNVRVIAEDDPLFDIVIPTMHPYHDDVIFGKVRTEFPYSENIYNMDEYNGSIRNSKEPCDIDKDFIDPCFACQSSKYNLDVEIQELTNDRIIEAIKILEENMPFHAVLHNLNILGGFHEFVSPPEEDIEGLVRYSIFDDVIAGTGQMWFNRAMKRGTVGNAVLRNQLATTTGFVSGSGLAYNDKIVIFCGDIDFEKLGMAKDGTAILEILTSSLAGSYRIDNPNKNTAQVSYQVGLDDISEPITEESSTLNNQVLSDRAFNFRILNPSFDVVTNCNVWQDNLVQVTDDEVNYQTLGIKTQWDITHGPATAPWKMSIPAYSVTPYEIKDILPDGTIVLDDPAHTLPSSNVIGMTYTLLDEYDNVKASSTTGFLQVTARGRTEVLSASVKDIFNVTDIGHYQLISGTQYKIIGYVPETDDQFYIAGYSGGDITPTTLTVYQRVADNQVGYLSHNGLKLDTSPTNHETSLPVSNGGNSVVATPLEDNRFKENYLVEINGELYFIAEIDGTVITLEGPDRYWNTYKGGGTSVSYKIHHYEKTEDVTIPGQQFDLPAHTFKVLDRRGSELITGTTNESAEIVVSALSTGGDDNVVAYVQQSEGLFYNIEYANGSNEQGEI